MPPENVRAVKVFLELKRGAGTPSLALAATLFDNIVKHVPRHQSGLFAESTAKGPSREFHVGDTALMGALACMLGRNAQGNEMLDAIYRRAYQNPKNGMFAFGYTTNEFPGVDRESDGLYRYPNDRGEYLETNLAVALLQVLTGQVDSARRIYDGVKALFEKGRHGTYTTTSEGDTEHIYANALYGMLSIVMGHPEDAEELHAAVKRNYRGTKGAKAYRSRPRDPEKRRWGAANAYDAGTLGMCLLTLATGRMGEGDALFHRFESLSRKNLALGLHIRSTFSNASASTEQNALLGLALCLRGEAKLPALKENVVAN